MCTSTRPETDPVKVGRFLDLRTDFAFKRIFATDQNKEFLIEFLNQVFRGKKKIIDLKYQNTVQPGGTPEARSTIFDVRCTGANGEEFIIEMQRASQPHFAERLLFYTSSLIGELAKRGESWDFKLPGIYFVAIMDFHLQHFDRTRYLHHCQLRYDDPLHHTLLDTYGFTLIELPKFKGKLQGLQTDLDKWCFLFKNLDKLHEIPVSLNTGALKKLFPVAEVSKLSKEEYTMYQLSLLAKQTEYAVLKNAEEKAEKRGERKGEKKGEKRAEEKMIRRLLTLNKMSIADISTVTGWSEEAIQRIKDSMN